VGWPGRSRWRDGSGAGRVVLVGGHGLDDAVEVLQGGELDDDLALVAAHVHADLGLVAVGEDVGQFLEAGRDGLLAAALPRRLRLVDLAERDELLHGADGQALLDDALRQVLLRLGAVEGEEGAGVPRRQHSRGDAALDGRRQVQQAQRVRDVGPGPADARGELLVGGAEVLEELLVRGRLLQRVELLPVQVLHEGVTEQVVVAGVADDRRDGLQPGHLGRPPAALAHDELVLVLTARRRRAGGDRLQETDGADRLGELRQGLLVEVLARLARVDRDGADGQFGEVGAGDRLQLPCRRGSVAGAAGEPRSARLGGRRRGRGGRDEGAEAPPQATSLLAHWAAPPWAISAAASL